MFPKAVKSKKIFQSYPAAPKVVKQYKRKGKLKREQIMLLK